MHVVGLRAGVPLCILEQTCMLKTGMQQKPDISHQPQCASWCLPADSSWRWVEIILLDRIQRNKEQSIFLASARTESENVG